MGRAQFLHPLHIQLANGGFGYGPPYSSSKHHQQQHQPPQEVSVGVPSLLRLTPREDSTRVQLQRQRLRDQHAGGGGSVVSKNIPGFKTSAGRFWEGPSRDQVGDIIIHADISDTTETAFFASLRTNLRLHASPPPSPWSAPQSMSNSATSLPPPSPLSQPVDSPMEAAFGGPPEDAMADVPELTSYVTDSDEDRVAALKLVADSIAQMRQAANNALVWHPLNMAVGVALLALVARYTYETRQDKTITGLTCAGIIMVFLASFRYLTQGYLFAAEAIDWEWLGDADVIVTKFGDEVIGTVVVQWVSGEGRAKRKKAWRGEIIGWTVRLKYRKKGVGGALLEEAVKEAKKKGAETMEFADDHASMLPDRTFHILYRFVMLIFFSADSKRVLPSLYNSTFDKRDRKGRELLADLLEVSPTKGSAGKARRRRGDSR
ncbi:hypothetical protein B0A55_03196 [Friedmanniomyces simplex]|uniref:N-acetyltransferase domain-containing protein n=1 Tax=Friedmanniomyces simplex TaxID=329884 RepID=A0A4U0XIC1_9PEZI|nr:hypothetical protein B0A55_03196 [Friedmanniomyces simplex]